MYKQDPSQTSMENRARNPNAKGVRGVRVKLRTAIRKLGFNGKLATDFRRHPELHLIVVVENENDREMIQEKFSVFEDYQVKVYTK